MKNDDTTKSQAITRYTRETLVATGKDIEKTKTLIDGGNLSLYIAKKRSGDFHLHNGEELIIVVRGKINIITLKETIVGETGDILFVPALLLHKTESCDNAIILSIRNPE